MVANGRRWNPTGWSETHPAPLNSLSSRSPTLRAGLVCFSCPELARVCPQDDSVCPLTLSLSLVASLTLCSVSKQAGRPSQAALSNEPGPGKSRWLSRRTGQLCALCAGGVCRAITPLISYPLCSQLAHRCRRLTRFTRSGARYSVTPPNTRPIRH